MQPETGAPPARGAPGAEDERGDQTGGFVAFDGTATLPDVRSAWWVARRLDRDLWALHDAVWMGCHVGDRHRRHCDACAFWRYVRLLAHAAGFHGPTTARRRRSYRRWLDDLAVYLSRSDGGGQDG